MDVAEVRALLEAERERILAELERIEADDLEGELAALDDGLDDDEDIFEGLDDEDPDAGALPPMSAAALDADDLLIDVDETLEGIAEYVLAQIDEALACIGSGAYGLCVRCKRPISKERLAALPYAVRCIDCEQLLEERA